MKILVINCGSSSLKYQVFNMDQEQALAAGNVEKIGSEGSFIKYKSHTGYKSQTEHEIKDHSDAIKLVFEVLTDKENGVIADVSEIDAVGHRVVHAGEKYASSVLITDEVKKALRECIELAPLHNPPNITGIEACEKLMPNAKHIGVFDTAFHQTMPEMTYLYGVPYEYYEKYGVRRYGFHGTSHKYVTQRAAAMLGKDIKDVNIITCHLGNGASVTAVKNGQSYDTSMGFTPLEGLIMGTRCGDMDPAIVPFLMDKEGLNTDEINKVINKKSGVLGVSGVSNDFRVLEEAANEGNEKAKVALDMFAYRVRKYVGSYAAAINGAEAIVFTAGIGENSATIRKMVCDGLTYLGVDIDPQLNGKRGEELDISTATAKVKVLVIPTNEELMIARDTKEIIENL
ncbi:acetate kinase [Clostridium sp. 'deep sea']|uniref:acetate/propionate family kinase n=1 Tax=Clostridium sp. 'deep sea' TaxID=2779445 RepID=UPI0018964870|nr:acetate kinase [Clostridium sp. 'deep sea']QOR36081.1 acetate kinase [Clostridium sp. 'deep sea']